METIDDSIKTKREIEWEEIEALILVYQQGFIDPSTAQLSQDAANELITRFTPFFLKYIKLLTWGEINFYDAEAKAFVFSFVDHSLREKFPKNKKNIIYKFKFIVKTYGGLPQNEILSDMYEIFFKIAKRYKQMGKNFCGYLYNVFHHEMSRHIKKHIENTVSVAYDTTECVHKNENFDVIDSYIDDMNEKNEILDLDWISGSDCLNVFSELSPLDRKILIAYYIDDKNDKQIAESFGIHINTVNQRRRKALLAVLDMMPNKTELNIKRRRKITKKS